MNSRIFPIFNPLGPHSRGQNVKPVFLVIPNNPPTIQQVTTNNEIRQPIPLIPAPTILRPLQTFINPFQNFHRNTRSVTLPPLVKVSTNFPLPQNQHNPPPSKSNLPLFEIDITTLNTIIKDGYISKGVNSDDIVYKIMLHLTCNQPDRYVMMNLKLSMKYKPTKRNVRDPQKYNIKLSWEKTFKIQLHNMLHSVCVIENQEGVCEVKLDVNDIYNSIYKELSRNTHISDKDRKIPITFFVECMMKKGNNQNQNQFLSIELKKKSLPFFVCCDRKFKSLEKRKKEMKNERENKDILKVYTTLRGIHPNEGTSFQPISVYLNTNVNIFLKTFKGKENNIFVWFELKQANVLSIMREDRYKKFKNCLRIVVISPDLSDYKNRLKNIVSVNVRIEFNDGIGCNDNNKTFVIKGVLEFRYNQNYETQLHTSHINHNQDLCEEFEIKENPKKKRKFI